MVERPFIIVSPGRSGSSYVAGQFVKAGVWGGIMRRGDQWNKDGYFENIAAHKMLRREYGSEWVDGAFPNEKPKWHSQILRIISNEDYVNGPWLIKCGAFYWKVFKSFDPLYIKVWRDQEKILESYERTGMLNRFTKEERALIVNRQHKEMACIPGLSVYIE